jgi:hypothetical protein
MAEASAVRDPARVIHTGDEVGEVVRAEEEAHEAEIVAAIPRGHAALQLQLRLVERDLVLGDAGGGLLDLGLGLVERPERLVVGGTGALELVVDLVEFGAEAARPGISLREPG